VGYTKVISYGDIVELYEYEGNVKTSGRKKRTDEKQSGDTDFSNSGKAVQAEEKQKKVRRKGDVKRALLAFKRLVLSNLGKSDVPVLISLTYAENFKDVRLAHKDFNAFARNVRNKLDKSIRYICVAEFQERGAIHFHSLFWGISDELVREERNTRFFARLWGRGFVDVVKTDGNEKIAGYLAKYMGKTFADIRLGGFRAYNASRNVRRPYVDCSTIVLPYYYGYRGIDLSTATLLREAEYMTQWLGKGRYRKFNI